MRTSSSLPPSGSQPSPVLSGARPTDPPGGRGRAVVVALSLGVMAASVVVAVVVARAGVARGAPPAPAGFAAAPGAGARGPAPAPRDLLLDGEVRQRFVARWSGAFLRVRFHAPLRPGEDPDLRPWRYSLAALVEPPPGVPAQRQRQHGADPAVVASAAWLRDAEDVSLDLGGGRRLAATARPPAGDPREVPLVLLDPSDPAPLAGRPALSWAPAKTLRQGLRLWAIEWPVASSSSHDLAAPVLVDTALGARVEPPLARFWYAPVAHAAGLALVGPDGAVACVVFRAVPGVEALSLCAPGAVALVGAPRSADPDAPAGVDVRVQRPRVQTGRLGR